MADLEFRNRNYLKVQTFNQESELVDLMLKTSHIDSSNVVNRLISVLEQNDIIDLAIDYMNSDSINYFGLECTLKDSNIDYDIYVTCNLHLDETNIDTLHSIFNLTR
jgi:hypothetical protein